MRDVRAPWVVLIGLLVLVVAGAVPFARADTLETSALVERAVALYREGSTEAAVAAFDRAIAGSETEPTALYFRAELEVERGGDAARALAFYDRAIAARPDRFEARTGRARLLLETARFNEAIAELDRADALKRDDPDALTTRGQTYLVLGRTTDAVTILDRAANALGTALTWRWLGEAHTESGHAAEAEAAYRKALALDPGDRLTLKYLEQHLRWIGRTTEAVELYRGALRANPGDANAEMCLGLIAFGSGDGTTAVEHLTRARALLPETGRISFFLAEALLASGRPAEARREAERALAILDAGEPRNLPLADTPCESIVKANAAILLGRFDVATRALEEIYGNYRDHALAGHLYDTAAHTRVPEHPSFLRAINEYDALAAAGELGPNAGSTSILNTPAIAGLAVGASLALTVGAPEKTEASLTELSRQSPSDTPEALLVGGASFLLWLLAYDGTRLPSGDGSSTAGPVAVRRAVPNLSRFPDVSTLYEALRLHRSGDYSGFANAILPLLKRHRDGAFLHQILEAGCAVPWSEIAPDTDRPPGR